MSEAGGDDDEGTTILQPKPGIEPELDANEQCRRDGFDVVRKIPFAANSFFAFVRRDNSFHCLDQFSPDIKQRDNLMFNVFCARADEDLYLA